MFCPLKGLVYYLEALHVGLSSGFGTFSLLKLRFLFFPQRGRELLNPLRAPEPLPILIPSNFTQTRLSSCKGVKPRTLRGKSGAPLYRSVSMLVHTIVYYY